MATIANVTLTITKAVGLVGLNPGGTSNPVVTATIGSQSVSTPVVSKTTNPVFDGCTFQFKSCSLPTVLTLKVFNRLPFVDVEDLLGTATLTLFDVTEEAESGAVTTKAVTLSHGGNAALAQRAGERGCGTLHITYALEPSAASPVAPNVSVPGFPTAAASLSSRPEAVPIPSPAAHNISGAPTALPPPISIPVPVIATTVTAASLSSSSTSSAVPTPPPPSSAMRATNPAAENPAVRSPKILAASTAPALLPATLTPPSMTPARAPVSLGYLVASSAAAAPLADVPVPVNTSGIPPYVTYPVPGVRAQPEAPPAAVVVAPPVSGETYFANNNATSIGAVAASPQPQVPLPLSTSALVMPVAASTPQAAHYTASSLHSANAVARASPLAVPHSPSSSLYTSAAAPPVAQPQPLLVVPPNIAGATNPLGQPLASSSGSGGGGDSRPLSAMQLPEAGGAPPLFPASAAEAAATSPSAGGGSGRAVSAGAAVVAVAPRPAPWSNSNSGASTPAWSSRTAPSRQGPQPPQQQQPQRSPGPLRSSVASGLRGGASGKAKRSGSSGGAASTATSPAVPRPRSGEDLLSTTDEAAARALPKNRRESGAAAPTAEDGDAAEAVRLYGDPAYLFARATAGGDLAVFQRLKQVDPYLSHGFLNCRDYAGRTLLHAAAWGGQTEVLRVLLSSAAPGAETEKDRIIAASLLSNLRSTQGGNTVLHAAAMGGHRGVVAYLQQAHNRSFLALKVARNDRQLTPAEAAKESGFADIAAMLV